MRSRYDVDPTALDAAREQLGLHDDVRVTRHRYEHKEGRYIGWKDGVHRIGLDAGLSPRFASRVLWHELTHAAQSRAAGQLRGVRPRVGQADARGGSHPQAGRADAGA